MIINRCRKSIWQNSISIPNKIKKKLSKLGTETNVSNLIHTSDRELIFRIKGIQIGKEEIKLSWLEDHMILYVENLMEFIKKKAIKLVSSARLQDTGSISKINSIVISYQCTIRNWNFKKLYN